MLNTLTIASWNICLGISNKLHHIENLLSTKNIDILFIQEAEISNQTDTAFYRINGYNFTCSNTILNGKSRLCCYTKENLKMVKNEITNNTLELISIKIANTTLNGIYRPFKIPYHNNQMEYMTELIDELEKTPKTKYELLIGDFNLDLQKKTNQNYQLRNLFDKLDEYTDSRYMINIKTEPTWQRIFLNSLKESTLDHVYTNHIPMIKRTLNERQCISDHNLILVQTTHESEVLSKSNKIKVMDWSKYDAEILKINIHENIPMNMNLLDTQDFLSQLNQIILTQFDKQVEIKMIRRKYIGEAFSIKMIKLRRRRNQLYKRFKKKPSESMKLKIKNLEAIIKQTSKDESRNKVRKAIRPGDPKSLWKAVNKISGPGLDDFPDEMYLNGAIVNTDEDKCELFKHFFDNKVKRIVDEIICEENSYEGQQQVNDQHGFNLNVTIDDIMNILKEIDPKKSNGYDRIPMKVFFDCRFILAEQITMLFNKIIDTKIIPDQWKVSKTIPLHKKGDKKDIENYRPISNICSLAKIFERVILLKISTLEAINNVDLTGTHQHGFKKGHSTVSAMLEIQDRLATGLDKGKYGAMMSLDLSAAFDVVNHNKLFKILKKKGLPCGLVQIIKEWLTRRRFYVEVNGTNSTFLNITCGTLQGSVLGPVLFALFMSPIYDLVEMITYADDSYIISMDKCINRAISKVKMKVEIAINWLTQNGMKVNTTKTEFCIFSTKDVTQKTVLISGVTISSKPVINVLGVIFDSKLNWHSQITNTINKCKSTLHGLRIIRKYFNETEFLNIVNALFYSKLYYACQVWLLPSISSNLKRKLISTSSSALRLVAGTDFDFFSFEEIHILFNRATPEQWKKYQMANQLFNVINNQKPNTMWIKLQENFRINNRTDTFKFERTNLRKIGLNCFINRLFEIEKSFKFTDFNCAKSTFKLKCKKLFIT